MGLFVGSNPVKAVYVGPTPIKAVYVGSEMVWSATVQITLGTGLEARNQLRAALTARGLAYQTVTEIPFHIELVGTGSVQSMFYGCAALTSVPAMDTSSVTDMWNMFYGCSSLTSVPAMDTSSVTDMDSMFYGCSSLTYVPDLDTSQVVYMTGMFWNCSSLVSVPDMDTSQVTYTNSMFRGCSSLTDGNVRLIGRHPSVNTDLMIDGSGLTREPFYRPDGTPDDGIEVVQITLGATYEARNQLRAALTARGLAYQTVTEIPFDIELVGSGSTEEMFRDCAALTSVPAMDTSSVTNTRSMFYGCSSLTTVPAMDTSSATNIAGMFQNCTSLTYVPDLIAGQATSAHYMFWHCAALTDGNVRLIGKHPDVTTTQMINGSGLTRLPFYDAAGNPI